VGCDELGNLSVAYNDGTFSVQGSFSSSGLFGEMGNERNGVFLTEDDKAEEGSAQEAAESADALQSPEPAVLPAPLHARMRRVAK
jgi:hypothetical protein